MPVQATRRVIRSIRFRTWASAPGLLLVSALAAGLVPNSTVQGQATPVPPDYLTHELPTLGGDNGSVVEAAACAIHIDAAAPDIRVADNLFPAPGNDQDICDEREPDAVATPAPAATPVAAAPYMTPDGLGPNVAVVTTRTTLPSGLLVPTSTVRMAA